MQAFKVQGTFPMGINKSQPFTLEVVADDEDGARERTFALLGSRHRVNRRQVRIENLQPIAADEVTDPRAQVALGVE